MTSIVDNFDNPSYWNAFYGDDEDPFDWYSSDAWLAQAVESHLGGDQRLSVLEVGCGTSTVLCRLAATGFRRLLGIDFSERAIANSIRHAKDAAFDHIVEYRLQDAMSIEGHYDAVIDKGCLDCFISSERVDGALRYLDRVADILLASGGTFFLVAVNAADIHVLLQTGEVVMDEAVSGNRPSSQVVSTWNERMRERSSGRENFVQRLFVHEIVIQDEKHLYRICGVQTTRHCLIRCNMCDRMYSDASALPEQCHSCFNRLQRFTLS